MNYFTIPKVKLLLLTLIATTLITCQEDKISVREYPRIDISDKVTQSPNGMTFEGEIITEGKSPVIESGFVWSTIQAPNINTSRIYCGPQNGVGTFSATPSIDFIADSLFKVKAFVKTDQQIIYSKELNIKSEYSSAPPKVSSIVPNQAKVGAELTISGENFSFLLYSVKVYFNSTEAEILNTCDTTITVKAPSLSSNKPVDIMVQIHNQKTIGAEKFNYINAEIVAYSPQQGTAGDIITITGNNFPDRLIYCRVKIGGVNSQIFDLKPNSIKVIVPKFSSTRRIFVEVNFAGEEKIFDKKFTFNLPQG